MTPPATQGPTPSGPAHPLTVPLTQPIQTRRIQTRHVQQTIDLALRVGEILLASGAGAADVTATMRAITEHYGLRGTDIDVTFVSLRMSHQVSDEVPVMLSRTVPSRDIDYDDLTRVHLLVREVLQDRIGLDDARRRVARVSSSGHWIPRWAVVGARGLLGSGAALLFGGGPVLFALAFLAGAGIDLMLRAMQRRRWPMFYQQAAGGLLATMVATGTAAGGLSERPSVVISASVVLLLSGIGFLGATQDALSGYYLTAGARILEAMLATSGLIAGVIAGLGLAELLGVDLGRIRPGAIGVADLAFVMAGTVIAALAFALAAYAPVRSLFAVAVVAVVGGGVYGGLLAIETQRPWAAAVAAVAIGLVSYSVAGRVGVPPLAVVVPALVPMLPGLSIYEGLSYVAMEDTRGIFDLVRAVTTTLALAAGVILGEYLAQPLTRNARKLETRLAGPRLVGALHGQVSRRPRRGSPGA